MKTRENKLLRILASIGAVGVCLMVLAVDCFAAEPTWSQTYSEARKLDQQGQWADSLSTAKLALKKAEGAFGRNSLNAAKSHMLLGDLWAERGRSASAEMHYVRGINLREKVLGPEHPSLIEPLIRLSDLYATHGKTDLAAVTYAKAIEMSDRNGRSHDPSLAAALVGCAGISRRNGNFEEAEALLNRAMDLCNTYRKYDGTLNTLAVRSLYHLAEIHKGRSHFSQAADCYYRALTVLERDSNADKLLMCSILSRLADMHTEHGSTVLARDYDKRARALYAATRGPGTAIGIAQ
jgi:tetratricopeptide (TPR) repeat protein